MCLLRKIVLILSDVIILRSRLSDSIRHDWSVIAQFPSIGIHDDKQTVFYCILIFIERDETRRDAQFPRIGDSFDDFERCLKKKLSRFCDERIFFGVRDFLSNGVVSGN